MNLRINGIGIYGPHSQIGPACWPFYDLIVLLEGNLTLELSGEPAMLYAHDAVLVPPGITFVGTTGPGGGMIWVQHFSARAGELPRTIPRSERPCILRSVAGSEVALALLRRVHALREASGDENGRLRHKLFDVLLHELGYAGRVSGSEVDELKRLHPAVAWAESHLGDAKNLRVVALQARLSESHFRRLFRKWRNQSAGAWLQERRMSEARRLLSSTDLPLKEIGPKLGFGDAVSFNRSFRQFHGLPPGRFRKANPRPV
jgi:AraC-like DNA-binding protein